MEERISFDSSRRILIDFNVLHFQFSQSKFKENGIYSNLSILYDIYYPVPALCPFQENLKHQAVQGKSPPIFFYYGKEYKNTIPCI